MSFIEVEVSETDSLFSKDVIMEGSIISSFPKPRGISSGSIISSG
jgi:hypothetical protein